MTSITLTVTGAKARASVNGSLTSGMVGIPVTIEYDDTWKGLTKNLVCRCGKWGPEEGETRTVLNVGETATVAHEVMKAGMYLYLGIEGYSADGKLVIPTTWADCGKILHGANANEDPSANPKLSIWQQLQSDIRKIEQSSMTDAQVTELVEAYCNKHFTEMPDVSQDASGGISTAARNLLITILRNGVYSTDQSANITALEAALASSDNEEEPDEPHTHSYTSSVTKAATCETAGVRTYTCSCGHSYTEEIPATGHNYADGVCVNCGEVKTGSGDSNGTLLYNWDFTKSLTDTVAGNTAVLNGDGATQDSNGLSIVRNGAYEIYASFATNIHGANRRYELDVSSFTSKSPQKVAPFVHCSGLAGFFYIANVWKFYSQKSWAFEATELTDVGIFDGKTVSIVINEDYFWDVYSDGELVAQSGAAISKSSSNLTLFSANNNEGFGQLLITGLRVYDLGGV